MPCVCSLTLQSFSGSIPPALPPLSLPPAALNVLAAASAEMSAAANATASANLAMSASASAKLALMASLNASMNAMGMASFNANAAAALIPMINSLNANLPTLPAGMLPTVPSLNAAGLLAAVMANLMKQWGINLAAPGGIAALQAKLNAVAAARASAAASATAAASAQASAAASASAAMSASAQASALAAFAARVGLPLTPPDSLSQLIALVNSLMAMKLPPITIPPVALGNALAMFQGLANILNGMGVNMLAPGAMTALASAMANVNLNALANVNVAANLNAAAAANAAASASAAANANAALAAKLDAALAPVSIPQLSALAQLMALAAALKALGKALPTSPCQVCTFLKK